MAGTTHELEVKPTAGSRGAALVGPVKIPFKCGRKENIPLAQSKETQAGRGLCVIFLRVFRNAENQKY